MPLKKAAWEKFCVGIVCDGLPATRAYMQAYPGSTYEAAGNSAYELLKNPEISQRLEDLKKEITSNAVEATSLDRWTRIQKLEKMARDIDQIIAERAASDDAGLETIPGTSTGLIWWSWKGAGKQLVKEHQVDYGLLKEQRAIFQQIATEMGEWLVKTAVDLRTDLPTADIPENASIEDIRLAKQRLQAALDGLHRPKGPERIQ